uniref:Transcription factor TFIIE alpha subunit C-terminal domain-containing protein n=2 Tax=Parascaris univalens TaxID=6257 RepID=A0A915CK33_PARUN
MRREGISHLTWSYLIHCSFDAVRLHFLVHPAFYLRVTLVWMGLLFSREGDLDQSTQHEELLSWAAEIVARQRETQQADQRSDQHNPESGTRVQNTHYFASLAELLRELLHEGEINLHPMSRYRELNEGPMQSSEDESEDGEYLIGLRGRNAFELQSSTNDEMRGDNERMGRRDISPTSANIPTNCEGSSDKYLNDSREYLLSEIKLHCGALAGWMGIEKMTAMREMGLLYGCRRRSGRPEFSRYPTRAAFSSFQRASVSNLFFPNRRKVVEKVRTKTFCCQYMPDGDGLLTASQDEVIRLYEREGYRQRYKLSNCFQAPYVGWSILDLVVSPDSRHCVYCTWSEKLYQCSLEADVGEDDRWTTLHQNHGDDFGRFALFSLRFNFDGTEIVSAGSDGRLYVYDRNSSSNVLSIPAHEDDVNAVSFGDTSRYLIFSAGDDGLCKVWDRRALGDDHRPVGVFAGHRDGITYVDSKGDDRYLLTNAKDQSIKLWDIRRFSSASAQEETRRAV